jgi:hypothetical protein
MVRNSGNAYGIHDEKQPNQFRADEMKEESDGRDGLFSHFMMQAITCLSSSSSPFSFWTGRSGALVFKEWVLGIYYHDWKPLRGHSCDESHDHESYPHLL